MATPPPTPSDPDPAARTATAFEPPHPNGAVPVEPDPPTSRFRRRLALLAFGLLAVAWAIALVYSVTRDNPEPLGERADTAVRGACDRALDRLRELPEISEATTPDDLAARIDVENGVFTDMVRAARASAPIDTDGRLALDAWLADWEAVLQARAAHAEVLRTSEPASLVLPTDDRGRPVTVRMDEYVESQGLPECAITRLQVEIVDGPRFYPDAA